MKFIHTSDWHIGRQFHNVSLLEDQRHVLQQLIGHITEHDVDALVIAGDIYDRSVPPATAVSLLDEVLHEVVNGLGVPVILIPGNHDSAERVGFGSRQLRQAGLHIISSLDHINEPVRLQGPHGEVHFFGIPYSDPEHVRSHFQGEAEGIRSYDDAHGFLVERVQLARVEGVPTVLVSHCFVDGAQESESERPLSVGGADRVSWRRLADFDYVALGHLHAPQHSGEKHIRYSGSLLKYSFSEVSQPKGVTLVEIGANNKVSTTHLPTTPLRDLRIIEGNVDDILANGVNDTSRDDYLLVRLLDNRAHLDVMNRLRAVYPNILHLERPGLEAAGEGKALRRDQLKRSELDIFADFYREMKGDELDSAQREVVEQVINGLNTAKEENV